MLFSTNYRSSKLATILGYLGGLILAIAVFTLYVSFTDASMERASGIIWTAILAVVGYTFWQYSRHISGIE